MSNGVPEAPARRVRDLDTHRQEHAMIKKHRLTLAFPAAAATLLALQAAGYVRYPLTHWDPGFAVGLVAGATAALVAYLIGHRRSNASRRSDDAR
jgi:hypothetical protein